MVQLGPPEAPKPQKIDFGVRGNSGSQLAQSADDPLNANGLKIGKSDLGLRSYTESNFRHNLIKLTGGVDPRRNYHAHHIVPKEFINNPNIINAGINVHSPANGTWLPSTVHHQGHAIYNNLWRQFLSSPRRGSEIRQFAQNILFKFGAP